MDFPGFKKTIQWTEYKEGFESPSYNTNPDLTNQNIATIQSIQSDIINKRPQLLQNYSDISADIATYNTQQKYLHDNNKKYHYDDKQDPNIILRPEESKDIKVAIQQDIQQMKLYQNSIYITGTIAAATLLIATIIFVKK
jgi:hypothetical protein